MSGSTWDAFARGWLEWAGAVLLEGSIVLLVALALWLPFRRRASATLGYGLFLVVLLRVAVPVGVPVPSWLGALAPGRWLAGWIEGGDSAGAVGALVGGALGGRGEPPAGPTWLCVAWLCGVAALVLLHARRRWRTAAVVARARSPRAGEVRADFAELCRRAGVRRPVRLLVSDELESPAAGGLRAPYVLMPAGLLRELRARPLRWVLLHELAHLRRGDVPVALLQDLAGIVLFFHPAVWIANRLLDEQRELACDAAALAQSGVSRQACGDGFLTVVEWAQRHQRDAGAALAMFRPRDAIRKRLMHMLRERPRGRAHRALHALFAALASLMLLPAARATAEMQDPQRPQRAETARLRELEQTLRALEQQQAELLAKLRDLRREMRAEGSGVATVRQLAPSGQGGGIYRVETTEEVEEVHEIDEIREIDERGAVARPLGRGGRAVYVIGEGRGEGAGRGTGVYVLQTEPSSKGGGGSAVLRPAQTEGGRVRARGRAPTRIYESRPDGARAYRLRAATESETEAEVESEAGATNVIVERGVRRATVRGGARSGVVREVGPETIEVIVEKPARARDEARTKSSEEESEPRAKARSGSAGSGNGSGRRQIML